MAGNVMSMLLIYVDIILQKKQGNKIEVPQK